MSLLWRVFIGNAAVLGVATLALVLSPATVSFPLAAREAVVLAAGLAVMLAINYGLLRRTLAPLRRLTSVMGQIDPLLPGRRAQIETGTAEVDALARAFDAMLGRLEAERRDSARRALAAQEDERRRVARELHDEVGQSLTAVVLQLERGRRDAPPAAAARMAEAQTMARATLEEVRAIARNLRPEALDDLGLPTALRQLCLETERAGLAVERHIETVPGLAPEVEVVIYRVAQEAIANVLRHAGAERLALRLLGADRGVRLEVVDDGRGPQGSRPGAGTRGMRERALMVGATLEVGPAPDRGTQVILRVP